MSQLSRPSTETGGTTLKYYSSNPLTSANAIILVWTSVACANEQANPAERLSILSQIAPQSSAAGDWMRRIRASSNDREISLENSNDQSRK